MINKNSINNYRLIFPFILLFVILSGCTYFPFSLFSNYPIKPKIYRDSLLINYYLYRHSEVFDNYFKIDIKIGNIYYSPDSLKGFGFYRYKFFKDTSLRDSSLMGLGFAMIRDSINQPWEIFLIHSINVFSYTVDQDVFNSLENYYRSPYSVKGDILNPRLNYFKIINQNGYIVNNEREISNKKFYSKDDIITLNSNFLANFYHGDIYPYYYFRNSELGTEDFWTNSFYFKKGSIVPWLYNFQLKRTLIVDDQEHRNFYQYPDSIIDMYKGVK